MIFQHTIDKVLSGEKTQTRRIVKSGETMTAIDSVHTWQQRLKWYVGQNLSVQPGRGKKSVARIRITGLRREDVREISADDVKAEGFQTASDFFITWCKMHDKGQTLPIIPDYYTGSIIWQGVRSELATRPAERYQAWVLTFELVKAGES